MTSNTINHNDVRKNRYLSDPEYRKEVDRTALAEAVSLAVLHYRVSLKLTQAQFAAQLGWKQPHIARLEAAEHSPSLESLQRLAAAGVIEVTVDRDGTQVRELARA